MRASSAALDLVTLAAGDDELSEEHGDYAALVRRQLALLGEDPEREGLVRTPERVAKAMGFLTAGYEMTVEQVVGSALFEEEHENMVMVRDIELYSLCEHHLLPFVDVEYAALVQRQLAILGEDPEREGLVRTPERVAKAMRFLTAGYEMTVEGVVGSALFEEEHENMVMVRDIELYSLCEHHMLPFFGKAYVAYIPNGRIVGLSKLPRIVEMFARRLQVQERLTDQVASAIDDVLAPRGVGVVIEAFHMCMMMRGVEKQNSRTITSALRGVFRDDGKTRDEFLRLAYASAR